MENVIHLLSLRNHLGEGPLWVHEENALYWVDIERGAYLRYLPASGRVERVEIGTTLGVMRLRQSGGMVMASGNGFQFWDPVSRRLTPIVNPEAGKIEGRLNDGMIDPQGRFWAGTMAPGFTSALYRLDPDLSLHQMESGIGISNGLGWSLDSREMYFTDSRKKIIYAYDFDPVSGEISNRRNLIATPDEAGSPDGMTVDSEGFIWSARWGGWKLSRYDPQGKLEREVVMPVEFPTSCAFGGADLDQLYITSAWMELGEDRKDTQPWSGDLFMMQSPFRGLPERKFAG
ncbi:MAG TPA: SMP-30/gluconolactonase/LRE family protein [Anaerolineaceae bacterium]